MAGEPPVTETAVVPLEERLDPRVVATYRELEEKVRLMWPGDDTGPLRTAFEFAAHLHAGQVRESGEPYMIHPLAVADILADRRIDLVGLQAGLLHDVVEDTETTIADLHREFGRDVAHCVDGVTKLGKVHFYSREERQAENVRRMLLAMVTDIRVILVKLADRLHNMRTLDSLSRDRQERIASETLEIYAPIAHRLGMGRIRGELEDLAFAHLEPDEFQQINEALASRKQSDEEFLESIRKTVESKLQREGIPARVEGRIKRAFSIHQKLKRQKIGIDQVYDLLGLRIVTDSVRNCYAALGVIHHEWRPIPGRIKDFIAIPRQNLYQSLHTSVMGPGGVAFEVQIRTDEMHRLAEEGIAAHWKYKEGKQGPVEDDHRVAWLRQLVEWQREMRDPTEFLSTLKVDLYPEEVYCFTPRGKVITLPKDASPIDFAYAIHSDVGQSCVGSKVNGRIVPLRYALRNGDVVEILTQPGHMPSRDWLSIVKTSRARNKIRHVIRTTEREKAIEIGLKSIEKEARRNRIQFSRITNDEMQRVAGEYGFSKIDDLYAALGYGKYSARQVMQKLAPQQVLEAESTPKTALPAKEPERRGVSSDLVIKVRGVDDLLVYRAKCCNPIRGEAIVGYITRGKGVAVHATSCPNVQNLMYEVDRKIDVEWARSGTGSDDFLVKMMVYTDDRPGMLNQLTSVLFGEGSDIRSLEARSDTRRGHDGATVDMTIEVKDKKQFERIAAAMRRLPGVRDVERIQ